MSRLVKIKYYDNAIEANRDVQVLEEYGIKAFIANEQTIQSDWLLSQAVGGLQLQVFEEHREKALEILENFKNEEKPEIEVEHTLDDSPFDFTCPKCGSNHLYRDEKPGGIFGVSILLLGIPFTTKNNLYHCYYCGNEFKIS